MSVLCRESHVFSIATITAMSHIVDVTQIIVGRVVNAEIYHHPLTDAACRNSLANSRDIADRVTTLYAREGERVATSAPRRPGIRVILGAIGRFPHPDIRIVHAAGSDFDRHFARTGTRDRKIIDIDELV